MQIYHLKEFYLKKTLRTKWKPKSTHTVGQFAGVGVPQYLDIDSNWSHSLLAWKMGFRRNSSPRIQLYEQIGN